MIVRIQANGGSFRGAGLYYLHDKSADATLEKHLKPKSDDRVWFTETRNCLSIDPGRALEEMWRTAEDQAYLKMQAGVKRGGRVCQDPTKTLSLSWHKDDQPTPEHMVEAADALMKHMGWDAHQAVYVGHNDTEHRHIHVILNRVNPDTGRTLDDYREQKRAQSWALDYERSQEQVRCEQREANAQNEASRLAGKGAERASDNQREAAPAQQAEPTSQQRSKRPQPQERPRNVGREASGELALAGMPEPSISRAANDHLPHNVIMMARPSERQFKADEQLGAEQQVHDRAELKSEQRAEREAFFKDGAKLFKATRHAVYDEVRQEYKAEWRDYYKSSAAARALAEAASKSGVGRAFHFAKEGQWENAREAFNDRDSLREVVEKELAERKADLKQRQNDDLRERQHDACNALRHVRDAQYQELLQRQRDERAVFKAGETLEALGIGREQQENGTAGPPPELAANENQPEVSKRAIVQSLDEAAPPATGPDATPRLNARLGDERVAQVFQSIEQTAIGDRGASINLPGASGSQAECAPAQGVSDLVAGGIGAAASYLADQLGEFFAPTPPEARETQAKAEAKAEANRETERPTPDDKAAAYDAIIESAVRAVEEDRARHGEAWWKERDKGKGFERDQ